MKSNENVLTIHYVNQFFSINDHLFWKKIALFFTKRTFG